MAVDGFFVAKFKKIGVTPPNAVGANGPATNGKPVSDKEAADDFADKAPIVDSENEEDSDFGGWDSEEDAKLIERARRSELRRKGKNPKAAPPKVAKPTANGAEAGEEGPKAVEEKSGAEDAKEGGAGGSEKAKKAESHKAKTVPEAKSKESPKAKKADSPKTKKADPDAKIVAKSKSNGAGGKGGGADKPRRKSGGKVKGQ